MRVDDARVRLDVTSAQRADGACGPRGDVGVTPADRVALSAEARVLAGLRAEIGPLDEVREERVAGLRAEVGTGAYRVATETVARELLVDELGGLLPWAA
jgi:anti-sigma28 factor (negative regulator of flagellin synthesis)